MSLDFQPIKPTPQLKYMEYLGESGTVTASGGTSITHNKGKSYDGFIITPIIVSGSSCKIIAHLLSSTTNVLTISYSDVTASGDTFKFRAWGIVNAGF